MTNNHNNIIKGRKALFIPVESFKLLIFLFCFLCPLLSFAQNDYKNVRVGIYENSPKVFTAEDGSPSGIFIDIIEFIAKSEGWNLKYVKGTWADGLNRLEKGEIDLMPDVAYTVEREKKFSFHKVQVLSSWFQAYSRKGSGIQSILDLNGKKIAILEKSVQQDAFMQFAKGFKLNMTLIPVPDYRAAFEIVSEGKADAAITNQFYGATHAKKYSLEGTAVVFEPSSLFFAATKGKHEPLLNTIDVYLENMKKDPDSVYYRSIKELTSEDIQFKIPLWLQISGLFTAIILLMSFCGSIILKRQVNMRTCELQRINQEIEQRIVDRTAELAEAMKNAQAADRLKSAFLATMSHELRTPLNSIIGFTGILLQGLVGPLNEEQKKQMGMVRSSANHLLSLINDVLDISKIEAGELKIDNESFDLLASINKVKEAVGPLSAKKGVILIVNIADDVTDIVGDMRRVEQVLLNLLSNAVKFTDEGHVKVSAEIYQNNVVISISDTGIGIKREDIDKLFKPFLQIDSGLSRKYEGTGLGLSICKKLVKLMGGEIIVESEYGKGSIFTFTLPLKKQKEEIKA